MNTADHNDTDPEPIAIRNTLGERIIQGLALPLLVGLGLANGSLPKGEAAIFVIRADPKIEALIMISAILVSLIWILFGEPHHIYPDPDGRGDETTARTDTETDDNGSDRL